VLGTHNSYHIQPRPELLAALLAFDPMFHQIEYTHPPLVQQFGDEGIRQIELDVYADPAGGLYAHRAGLVAIGEDPDSPDPAMYAPGFKVLHIQDIDFETRCLTFVDCLRDVKGWSDAHPGHLPIMILVEAEEDVLPRPRLRDPDPHRSRPVRRRCRSARLPPEQLITSTTCAAAFTLDEAVRTLGWPTPGHHAARCLRLDNGGSVGPISRDIRAEGRSPTPWRAPLTPRSSRRTTSPGPGSDPAWSRPADCPDLCRRRYRAGAHRRYGRPGRRARQRCAVREHGLPDPGSSLRHGVLRRDPQRRPRTMQPGQRSDRLPVGRDRATVLTPIAYSGSTSRSPTLQSSRAASTLWAPAEGIAARAASACVLDHGHHSERPRLRPPGGDDLVARHRPTAHPRAPPASPSSETEQRARMPGDERHPPREQRARCRRADRRRQDRAPPPLLGVVCRKGMICPQPSGVRCEYAPTARLRSRWCPSASGMEQDSRFAAPLERDRRRWGIRDPHRAMKRTDAGLQLTTLPPPRTPIIAT
jgi:hypothetical protein